MFRFAALFTLLAAGSSQAAFTLTGNPAVDPGWTHSGHSLGQGDYARGTANIAFNIYNIEFNLPAGPNPLTTMANPWTPGSRVVGIGGVMMPGFTPEQLGWPTGTVFTGPSQNALVGANARIVAKFGTDTTGPGGNAYTASSTPPNVSTGASGSHSAGNGGVGSVQVSIASNRFIPANAGLITMPTNSFSGLVTGPDNVAQFVTSGATGLNGLDLISGGVYPSARYIFTTDPNTGFLSSWQVLLNTTMVSQFPGTNPIVPTGGGNWIATVQAGSGPAPFTDGLIATDPFVVAPAPPAIWLGLLGGASLLGLRRRRN